MKYIITGSIGHIGRPLTEQLVAAGHQVTVVTSSASRNDEIKNLGAEPAVGSIEDRDFLTKTFAGADAVYLMIPPPPGDVVDWPAFQRKVADNYIAAAKANKTKYVAILSSMGAHLGTGAGPVDGAAYLERQSATLPDVQGIHILRPSFFYYNLFAQIGMIQHAGFVGSTQPAAQKVEMVHPSDIANAAAKYLLSPTTGTSVEYIVGQDDLTWADITKVLGTAIGKPDLPFVELTDEQSKAGMLQAGMNPAMAEGFTIMNKAHREGKMQEEYWKNRPSTLGKVKLADFVKEFTAVYNAS